MTKLQVSKSKRTLSLVENRPIQLSCSVRSQTSQNSHFAVLWYVHKPSDADGKLILKTTHSSAFEYGTYAEEEGLRARLQFERHMSGGLFSLTVQRAEVSDSGSYYCHVEEWLLSPNYAWYKLAEEVSGRTEVTVKQPGKDGMQPSLASGLVQRTTWGWQGSAGSTPAVGAGAQASATSCGAACPLPGAAGSLRKASWPLLWRAAPFPGSGLRGSRARQDVALWVSGLHPGSGAGASSLPSILPRKHLRVPLMSSPFFFTARPPAQGRALPVTKSNHPLGPSPSCGSDPLSAP